MANSKASEIGWLPEVEEHNYPAAQSYLSLIYAEAKVSDIVDRMRRAPVVQFKAKDVFRASGLSLLGVSNVHVERDRNKILSGKSLSPLLLLRDEQNGKVVIADGYHRMCAIYGFNEDALIHCKIV